MTQVIQKKKEIIDAFGNTDLLKVSVYGVA